MSGHEGVKRNDRPSARGNAATLPSGRPMGGTIAPVSGRRATPRGGAEGTFGAMPSSIRWGDSISEGAGAGRVAP